MAKNAQPAAGGEKGRKNSDYQPYAARRDGQGIDLQDCRLHRRRDGTGRRQCIVCSSISIKGGTNRCISADGSKETVI